MTAEPKKAIGQDLQDLQDYRKVTDEGSPEGASGSGEPEFNG
jgi:hypothetical protein